MSDEWRVTGRFLLGSELFEAVTVAQKVFVLNRELPAQVFHKPIDSFVATDSIRAVGGVFAHVLNRLGGFFSDKWCCVLLRRANDDDLVPGFRFDLPIEPALLWSRLNYEPDGEVLRSYTSVASSRVFAGSSGSWGCWADRDWELAVVGTACPVPLNCPEVPFHPVLQELKQTLGMSKGTLSSEDEAAFRSNYS